MFWTIKGYYFEFEDYFYGSGEGNKREEVDLTLVGRKHVQTIVKSYSQVFLSNIIINGACFRLRIISNHT